MAPSGWTYALTLGFGLVYLGEHYVVRPDRRRSALADGVRRLGPAVWPVLRRVQRAFQRLEPRTR